MSLQLGWYKDPANGKLVHLRLFADDVENSVAVYQRENKLHEMHPNAFARQYEYVSTEKPDVWIAADPDKITLGMLPLRARFRDHYRADWFHGSLSSYRKENRKKFQDDREFVWKHCEVAQ